MRGCRVGLLVLAVALLGRRAEAAQSPCHTLTFEGDGFIACLFDPAQDRLVLANRTAKGPVDSFAGLKVILGRRSHALAFAMNAGMYEADQSPVGLLVERGHERHPLNTADAGGNFYLKPNGVFWVDRAGRPHVDETSAFAALNAHPVWATQSGPLLLDKGALHPAISQDGTSLYVRDGVGVTDGQAWFVISQAPVSFGRFARAMRDELGCRDALYLDGSIASLWAPSLGRMDARTGLGTFVAVIKRRR